MTKPSAAASAAIDIDRPTDVVRAHFFDVDHAIRDNLHHGVTLRRLPPEAPGELRVEEETKVLARPQVGIFVIESGEGGAFVKRYVAGPNAGTSLVASFAPAATPSHTAVTLVAFVGEGGYRTGLGRLSPLGLEKLLQKTLGEHRRALGGQAPSRAAGAVQAVLLPMREAVVAARAHAEGEARAVMTNLLEAACVVAVADGLADDAEREVIQEVARTLCSLDLDAGTVDRMVRNITAAVATEGLTSRCDKVAHRLRALGLAEVGLGVAALVAQVSHGIGVDQHCALTRLAEALGLGEEALGDRIRRTDRALSGS